MKKNPGIAVMFGPGPDKEPESDYSEGKASAAMAVREALAKKDDDALAEALESFFHLCDDESDDEEE